MTRNARNRFVAWLGIAAMWLAIVAPVISQTLDARNAASDPQATLCAVDSSATDAHEGHHAAGQDHTAPELVPEARVAPVLHTLVEAALQVAPYPRR